MRRLIPLKYIRLCFVLYLSDTVFFHSRGKYRADSILQTETWKSLSDKLLSCHLLGIV